MKQPQKRAQILLAVALLLYACGYVTQFIGNYAVWQKNGGMLGGTSPPFPSLSPLTCLKGVLWFPYNLYCMAGCAAAVAVIFLYRKLFSQDALTDSERNFDFSAKGTYGTSGWMQTREVPAVLDMVSDLSQHTGTVLGMLDGKFLCIPEKTRMNGNLAVYGASGSMKTRSFCMNRILQSAARGESLIICDPKSELYEKSSEYMRDLGYTVRVFNLVSPENSDSWNCLKEIEGQELMAQLFVDVIIKNTNGTGKSDRLWDSGEMNLLKALVLYVDLTYPPEQRTIGEVYNLITQCSESQLDSLFDVLPLTHPAKAPYSLYQRASDSVRSGVISGLGSRLQVFQSDLIKKITAYDEISLELPGQQHCAYYLVTSDQDSTFDFLASLFLSFAFIKLVRYADANCPGGRLPVPVHVLGEELTACGTISELSRRISVIRSRNISMSCVFQNLAGLQNRYPQNQWQEILGNCDVQLFLGCTDQLTAEYVSQRTGIASVAVSSTSKALSTLRVSDYTPQYRESSGVGKRSVLTPDEVLRLPVDEALVILRGHKVLKVRKMDYSLHPAYKQLRERQKSNVSPHYHDTRTLLRKYRDVMWNLEVSDLDLQEEFKAEYGLSTDALFVDSEVNKGGNRLESYARALERSKKMMQIIDTAIDLMRRKHKKGEFYYWILYYAYLSPQQCENAGAILQLLETKGISISLRTYYVHRDEAIEVLSSILWGYTSQDCEKITNLLTPD